MADANMTLREILFHEPRIENDELHVSKFNCPCNLSSIDNMEGLIKLAHAFGASGVVIHVQGNGDWKAVEVSSLPPRPEKPANIPYPFWEECKWVGEDGWERIHNCSHYPVIPGVKWVFEKD